MTPHQFKIRRVAKIHRSFWFIVTAWCVAAPGSALAVDLRVATYNSSLSPSTPGSNPGSLISQLTVAGDVDSASTRKIAEMIQRVNPDIMLINEFNWDASGTALQLFKDNFLAVGHDEASSGSASSPISFPYAYLPTGGSSPFNTGIPSGFDLNNNSIFGEADDAYGFGDHPGQYGMVILSKYPIVTDDVRTFQQFLWKDMPDNLLPPGYNTAEEEAHFRLSSKSHWDVPVDVDGNIVHVLASHPTPPSFDGAEQRNKRRNNDEVRFWDDYITPASGDYIYDDEEFFRANGDYNRDGKASAADFTVWRDTYGSTTDRRADGNNDGTVNDADFSIWENAYGADAPLTPANPGGGLGEDASFVIVGDQNADPNDGDGLGSIDDLLANSLVNTTLTPSSAGGTQDSANEGPPNNSHTGDPAHDTADFGFVGNLRVDYVLPSANLTMTDANVFWLLTTDPLYSLHGASTTPSDHRLVYVDLEIPEGSGSGAFLHSPAVPEPATFGLAAVALAAIFWRHRRR